MPRDIRGNRDKKRIRIQTYLNGIKAETPCADCGQQYDYFVMEFDHLGDKIASVYNMRSWIAVETELAKCEVVCSNCHAARTHHRRVEQNERTTIG